MRHRKTQKKISWMKKCFFSTKDQRTPQVSYSQLQRLRQIYLGLNIFFLWALSHIFYLDQNIEQILSTWFNNLFVLNAFIFFFLFEVLAFASLKYLFQIESLEQYLYNFFIRILLFGLIFIPLFYLFWHVSTNLEQKKHILIEFPSFFQISPVSRRLSESEAYLYLNELRNIFLNNKFVADVNFFLKKENFFSITSTPEFFRNCYQEAPCLMDFEPLLKNKFEVAWQESPLKTISIPNSDMNFSEKILRLFERILNFLKTGGNYSERQREILNRNGEPPFVYLTWDSTKKAWVVYKKI